MTTEFIIWGIAPGSDFEDLLVSEQAGIASREQAESVARILTEKHGCRAVRISTFNMSGDATEVANMFRQSVNA